MWPDAFLMRHEAAGVIQGNCLERAGRKVDDAGFVQKWRAVSGVMAPDDFERFGAQVGGRLADAERGLVALER